MKFQPLLNTLLLFIVLVSSCPAAVQEPIHIQSIQAGFVQEKHLKILARPLVSTGTFTFQAPGSLRWEYKTPVASVLLMYGGRIRKFVERDGQLVEDKGLGLDSMQVVLGQISSWLDGRFTDNDIFRVSEVDEHTVLLTPKDQALAGLISKIELKLADHKGILDGVIIYEGPESYTSMIFQNPVLNQDISAAVFTEK
ncbi:outer membrane lipoprotein carrier protein LolA [Desulforhopalus sp. IMCC35007]|uniref:LolA family protein n=1 Tax=Desulforhopalus sp. IMCC35007 TaxID=2569543 RepID=UPI0010AE3B1A|nr:outer membrane lipoprotein carrier protein LolA [Desulforhopalus sp. IMCC35007]TKB10828.1 outer membrane lipoprotein carrier protein LolA [Desulforhopalus sp. IMCC35007]